MHAANPSLVEKIRKDKKDFEKCVNEICNIEGHYTETVDTNEEIHNREWEHTVQSSLKIVSNDQEKMADGCFGDFIDTHVLINDKTTITCDVCKTANQRRKLICVKCGERSGLARARQKTVDISIRDETMNSPTWTEDSEVSQKTYSRYQHILSNHKDPVKNVVLDPVLVNPNSLESVKIVLWQIYLDCGIKRYGKQDRNWTYVTCDGRPHILIQNLMANTIVCQKCQAVFTTKDAFLKHCSDLQNNDIKFYREFDWFYLRAGGGHLEMNAMKALLELLWVPYLECLIELLGYKSDKAKEFIKAGKDNHI